VVGGVLLDRWGVRVTGSLFVGMMVLGAGLVLFALLRGGSSSLALAYVGCMLFGMGSEIAGTSVTRSIAKWFKGGPMALAMGLELAIARLGTAFALVMSPRLVSSSDPGHFYTLVETARPAMFGMGLMAVGLILWAVFVAMDARRDRGSDEKSIVESDKTFRRRVGEKSFSPRSDEKFSGGRRAFVTGAAIVAGTALLKAQEKKVDGGFAEVLPKAVPERDVPLTPPGSKSVKDFYRRCTACQLCVSECPNGVLRPSADLEHLMQPEMGFEKGFCRPECTRCSQLCPAGAIKPIGREEKTAYHVGTARVNLDACLSLKGVHCGNCATKCPTGAITMVETERGLTPVVAEQICIGCGACEYLCPVRPVSAITVNGREDHIL